MPDEQLGPPGWESTPTFEESDEGLATAECAVESGQVCDLERHDHHPTRPDRDVDGDHHRTPCMDRPDGEQGGQGLQQTVAERVMRGGDHDAETEGETGGPDHQLQDERAAGPAGAKMASLPS